jgi:hypothetical protein
MQCACPVFYSDLSGCKRFSTLSHERYDFRKKKKNGIKRVFCFYLNPFPETFFILRKTEQDVIKMYIFLQGKYPLFLSDFKET